MNKINDLEMVIAGSEPDLILITEILPKYHLYCIKKTSLMIPGYSLYLNFDLDSDITPILDIRGVEIFISNTVYVKNFECIKFRRYLKNKII